MELFVDDPTTDGTIRSRAGRWRGPMTRAHARLCLLGIVAAFLALQSVYLSHRWTIDESWYLMPIPSILEEGRFRIPTIPGDDEFWPQPPLLTYSEALSEVVQPLTASRARMIPLAFGCALIVTAYFLGRKLYGEGVGLLAAGLVASDNLVFLAARTVRPEILVALFVALALLAIARGTSRRDLLLAGLISGLGVSSHPNGLLAPGCAAILLLARAGLGITGLKKTLELGCWTLLAMVPLVVWIVVNDGPSGFEGFKSHWLGRYGRLAEETPTLAGSILALVEAEMRGRWSGFLQAPYRIHIALISILVIGRSLLSRDRTLRALGICCVLQLLFFIFVNNSVSSVRYMTPLIPIVAVIAGQWTHALFTNRVAPGILQPRALLAVTIVVGLGLSQIAGNGLYLWRARSADYVATVESLNELIPPDSRVYGSITFWLGLRNHTFVPYMRKNWQRALEDHDPNVMIVDDLDMADPKKRWGALRADLNAHVEEHGWTLLGEVDAGYYGQIKVYGAPKSRPRPPEQRPEPATTRTGEAA